MESERRTANSDKELTFKLNLLVGPLINEIFLN